MNCEQAKELITQYLLGDLDKLIADEVRVHLEHCDGCRAIAKEIEPTLDLLSDALAATSSQAPAQLSSDRRMKVLAAAETGKPRRQTAWMLAGHPTFARMAATILVIIATVGILGGLLMPASYRARERASMMKMGEVAGGGFVTLSCEMPCEEVSDAADGEQTVEWEMDEHLAEPPSPSPADGPQPASFDSVAAVKSPIVMKGLYGSRTPGSRGNALGRADGGEVDGDDGVEFEVGDRRDAPEAQSVGLSVGGKLAQAADEVAAPARAKPASSPVGSDFAYSASPTALMQEKSKHEVSKELGSVGQLYGGSDGTKAARKLDASVVSLSRAEEARDKDTTPRSREVRLPQSVVAMGAGASAPTSVAPPAPSRPDTAEEKLQRSVPAKELRMDEKALLDSPADTYARTVLTESEEARKAPDVAHAAGVLAGVTASGADTKELERTGLGSLTKKSGGKLEGTIRYRPESKSYVVSDRSGVAIRIPASEVDKVFFDVPSEPEPSQATGRERGEELEGPRFKAVGVNPFVKVAEQAFSTFSIDVDTASYTLARNYMLKGYLPPAESVRTEEFVNFFDAAYKAPERETFRIYVEAAPSKFGHGLTLMKVGIKGRRLGREEQRRAVLTFLVDTSGSMDKPDRLGLIKKSLRLLVDRLDPQDRITIVAYNNRARLVLEHVAVAEKARISGAIDALQCSGSTNLEEGMKWAYGIAARHFVAGGENRVLLLSDGVANLGNMAAEQILGEVERYRRQGIYCSVFGFGMGTYDDAMLETLANKGDGTYTFVDSEEEAERVFVNDLAATLNTIARDVKIQVEFNPAFVSQYRQMGYENRQLKKEDFRNDAVDAGEVGSGQSVTALYELQMGAGQPGPRPLLQVREEKIMPDWLAMVRVRYRRLDNGQVEEISQPVMRSDCAPSFDDADTRFRLAACVAEFSEILRGSPFAGGSEFRDVAAALRPVALELDLDKQVQELMRLVNGANGMSRAPMKE